jgi:predicted transcriptional regulator
MKLKELRQNKNLSVSQLVELSGVPRRTIQDIEKIIIARWILLSN